MESSRNIEIKARIENEAAFNERIEIAKKLCANSSEILRQRDIFFNTNNNRLKLRYVNDKAVLVNYSRPDVAGPKLSKYDLLDVENPALLEKILTETMGKLGEVSKTRYLYLHNQTRVHLDDVKLLGYFLEFEVVLRPEQSIEEGTQIAEEMMKIFEIKEQDLLQGAYMDEILKLKS